eukprot:scaffold176870_cov16-Prasinocladus_malaysianus.AAC.2
MDGAADDQGLTSQVARDFCSPATPFEDQDLNQVERLWLHAPHDQLQEFLAHYLRSKLRKPSLRGVFVVPKWTRTPWYQLLKNFRLVDEIPAGTKSVFTRATSTTDGTREDVGPTPWQYKSSWMIVQQYDFYPKPYESLRQFTGRTPKY